MMILLRTLACAATMLVTTCAAFAGPIHDAARASDEVAIQKLLDAGTDINERDERGHHLGSAFYDAVDPGIAEHALDEGARLLAHDAVRHPDGGEIALLIESHHGGCVASVENAFLARTARTDSTGEVQRSLELFGRRPIEEMFNRGILGPRAFRNGRRVRNGTRSWPREPPRS